MHEFELIRKFFSRPSDDSSISVGVGDDGAVVVPADGRELVVVMDTLVAAVHFPTGLAPADLGYRSVAVNLSDIAAMSATPRWMTLALTLTNADEEWVGGFANGLYDAAEKYGLRLIGGDTTSGPTTTVTVQIIGDIVAGTATTRAGASAGDLIFVSGTIGDAVAGLALLQADAGKPYPLMSGQQEYLRRRFCRPDARVGLGMRLAGIATAAIDVSDGLFADLHKLLQASRVGGVIEVMQLPLSEELLAVMTYDEAIESALAGGDDYELCFTAAAADHDVVQRIASECRVAVSCVGTVAEGNALKCTRNGKEFDYRHTGYLHFAV